MSTRSVIAVATETGFEGVYHHWDGYPEGLGRELHKLGQQWGADELIHRLITEHPEGWSTILGANWSYPAAARADDNLRICKTCGRASWRHYSQYYGTDYAGSPGRYSHGELAPEPEEGATGALVFAHPFEAEDIEHGPECFTGDPPSILTDKTASSCGCEYAYVIQSHWIDVYECRTAEDGNVRMTGTFGIGNPGGVWHLLGRAGFDTEFAAAVAAPASP